eukprot:TRINITY_DN18598_c1_g1_i2.p2 TRINITY_DN18598_c1_g1~~TRINITY_DN18598_c1_g1_i2.p2  ORF type:complete len:115 (+),score=2.38 TRINITY_DN18598_c1_g1_i2:51-395(+)
MSLSTVLLGPHRNRDSSSQYENFRALDENRIRRGVKPEVLQRYQKRASARLNNKECGICMEELKGGPMITELPCKHSYCTKCIQQWLADNDTCPICRWKFPSNQTRLMNLDRHS